jgi:hypothetical protein
VLRVYRLVPVCKHWPTAVCPHKSIVNEMIRWDDIFFVIFVALIFEMECVDWYQCASIGPRSCAPIGREVLDDAVPILYVCVCVCVVSVWCVCMHSYVWKRKNSYIYAHCDSHMYIASVRLATDNISRVHL